MNHKFCNSFVRASLRRVYHVTEAVQAVVCSIVVVGALTPCVLLHSLCDLKVQWELMFYKFELGYNTTEATKNICCSKGEAQLIKVL